MKPIEPDSSHNYQRMRSLPGNNIHMLAAAPKSRNLDNWIQPKANPEIKSYNQHWLIQVSIIEFVSEYYYKYSDCIGSRVTTFIRAKKSSKKLAPK